MSKYGTVPPEIETMPKGIPYIIGNEAAERFSFYGMRAILIVFMTDYLYLMSDTVQTAMSKAEAQEHYHTFVSWVYLFPIFGALISDALTGKYRIIMSVSVLYCVGHLALALMGTPGFEPKTWMWMGLIMIAVGAGGIKPCVSAHVGDQFGNKNKHLLEKVYQWFYFSINFGSTLSTVMIPVVLEWYGPHWAFGIPGILMGIATVMFWMGRNEFVHVPPAGPSFLKEVFSKEGILTILRLLVVFAAISVFWALFDQTSSAWVLQAQDMDLMWMGIEWLPSQFQVVNPILVMIMIPLFQFVIYPVTNKFFKLTPLRKMSIGLFTAAFAFALSSIVQGWIDDGETPSISWQILAYVIITAAEVMVSITGLEFSYTQAPKSMKSVIMSVWLFSVSLGNIVTAGVNHYIQVPGVGVVADQSDEFVDLDADPVTIDDLWEVRVEQLFSAAVVDEVSEDAEANGQEPDGSTEQDDGATEPVDVETEQGDDVDAPEADTEDAEESAESEENKDLPQIIRISGYDGEFDTDDDITLEFGEYHNLLAVNTAENDTLDAAKEIIDAAFMASDPDDGLKQLPDNETGTSLIADIKDSHGNSLTYEKITREQYRIISMGPDGKMFTPWDVVLSATVSRPDAEAAERNQNMPLTWRERRIIELKGEAGEEEVAKARGESPKIEIEGDISVGGLVTLEGDDYYWFWTWCMFVGAIVFVPIAYFYRGKTYIQGAEPAPHEIAETDAHG